MVGVSSGVPSRGKLRQGWGQGVTIVLSNIALGFGVLALAYWSPLTLFVLPPVLIAFVLAHRSSVRLMEQRDTWRRLNAERRR